MTTQNIDLQETEEVHDAVVSTPATPIKFDITTAAIAQMREKANSLSIAGPDDKVGFKVVYDFRQTVARQRVAVKKKQDALKRPHIDYNRDVDAAAKALIEPMADIENDLALQEKAYNDERERIAHELKMALQQRLESRVNELRSLGFVWYPSDETYTLTGGDPVVNLMEINFDDIKQLSDEEYEPTLFAAKMVYRVEVDRLADVKFKADQEAARIEAERKAKQDRIAAEQAEITRKNKEEADRLQAIADQQKAAQKQIDDSRAKFEKEKAEAVLKTRTTQLLAAGFVQDGNYYDHGVVKLRPESIVLFTDEQFAGVLSDAAAYDQKKQQERIDAEAAEAERIKAENKRIADKKKADKERTARLAPDKKEIKKYLLSLVKLPRPAAITQPEAIDFYGRMLEEWNEFAERQVALLEAL